MAAQHIPSPRMASNTPWSRSTTAPRRLPPGLQRPQPLLPGCCCQLWTHCLWHHWAAPSSPLAKRDPCPAGIKEESPHPPSPPQSPWAEDSGPGRGHPSSVMETPLSPVQCSSVTRFMSDCNTPGLPVHHQLPELTQTHVQWVGDAIEPSHPLSSRPLLLPASIIPSIRVFSNELVLPIRWPKYWSFSFSTRSSNDYSGLISFTMNCLDLLAVQGTLKSLLQHHSSKASTLWCSAFFIVQLSHPYMTTGKAIALTRWTFKVMSLLFNMLSRLVIAFLPRSKHSWVTNCSDFGARTPSLTLSCGRTWARHPGHIDHTLYRWGVGGSALPTVPAPPSPTPVSPSGASA